MVDDELKGEWARKEIPLDELLYVDDEGADAPDPDPILPDPSPEDADEFAEFLRVNVRAQVQLGYSAVEVKVRQGDLGPDQFRGLAQILRDHGAGRARTTPGQNIVLRWIPTGRLYEVWKELRKLDLGNGGAFEIHDVVSCPGTDSCKLGITSSMGLNRAISEKLLEMKITDPVTRKILINASGCPNSCGLHHIAEIGFHGAAMKSSGKQIPAYHVFLAGHRRDGNLRLGTLLRSRLPAKRVPEAVERIIRHYEDNRENGEQFIDFFDRTGKEPFDEALKYLTLPPEFSEESEPIFIDWERDVHYVLERGEGECAV
jgi:sulfite reductase beta subunit-like hemoprotein